MAAPKCMPVCWPKSWRNNTKSMYSFQNRSFVVALVAMTPVCQFIGMLVGI